MMKANQLWIRVHWLRWIGVLAYPAATVCGIWTATGDAPPLVKGMTVGLTIGFITKVAISFRQRRRPR